MSPAIARIAGGFSQSFIEWCFKAIRPEQQSGNPLRSPAHLSAYGIQIDILAAFDNQFIMNMATDETMGERPHGVHQNIHRNRPRTIFSTNLGTVTFNPLPILICPHAFIGDGFTAEAVLANPGLDIGEPPAGREGDEEHPALVNEPDSICFRGSSHFDGILYGAVNIPPELHNIRVGCAPRHLQGAGVPPRQAPFPERPWISSAPTEPPYPRASSAIFPFCRRCEFCPCFSTGTPNMALAGGAVDIPIVCKDLCTPILMGQGRKAPSLQWQRSPTL